jgi:hypothetical protein
MTLRVIRSTFAMSARCPFSHQLPTYYGLAEQRASNELVKIIRKLRWMGLELEAERLERELTLRDGPTADCVVAASRETD